ncbi:hypothetical protein O6P43_002721 [Quillaja saponaria]|uniref:Uncharacterized protein n=1 Tax=Quillaja saponaria TaxID=32244 RepID=A0AAD7QD17_QUISA|nr:hypothetical protein O6P43_002721 [Quillaja saponaria]
MDIYDSISWKERKFRNRSILPPVASQLGPTGVFHATSTIVEARHRINSARANEEFPPLSVQYIIDQQTERDRPNIDREALFRLLIDHGTVAVHEYSILGRRGEERWKPRWSLPPEMSLGLIHLLMDS